MAGIRHPNAKQARGLACLDCARVFGPDDERYERGYNGDHVLYACADHAAPGAKLGPTIRSEQCR